MSNGLIPYYAEFETKSGNSLPDDGHYKFSANDDEDAMRIAKEKLGRLPMDAFMLSVYTESNISNGLPMREIYSYR
jgi:hypothetical protein